MNDVQKEGQRGTLYVVATPIGNLEDITLRALRVLGEVALIASEDTRQTRKLLSRYEIHTPLISYYKEKEAVRAEVLLERLSRGEDVALVSDAGTPGISDPGAVVVQKALAQGISVVPAPGPSALTAALSVSGFGVAPLVFLGFLASRTTERRRQLQGLVREERTMVFFETPQRFARCLTDCLAILGDRQVFWARELTKIHEQLWSGTLSSAVRDVSEGSAVKGEFVVVIAGASAEEKPESTDVREILLWHKEHSGLTLRDAVHRVARDLNLSRTRVYQTALEIWKGP